MSETPKAKSKSELRREAEMKKEPKAPRQFTPTEVKELQELHRLMSSFVFLGKQVLGNTALVTDGQKFGEQLEQVGRLLTNTKQHWISQKLAECGYATGERVNIDLVSGAIIPESAVVKAMAEEKADK